MKQYEEYLSRLYNQTGQPGYLIKDTAQPSYEDMMRAAQEQQLAARADAVQRYVDLYRTQTNRAAQDARDSRAQAYANARLSAVGNNEVLAAQGLSGGLYDAPRSGYGESSRIRQDMNLRASLAGVDAAQIRAQQEIDSAVNQLMAQNRLEDAQIIRDNAALLIQLLIRQEQFDRQMELAYKQLNR